MLCPSYYCLYSLFNKIRDKGFCLELRDLGGEGSGGEREGRWVRGRNDPNVVCTYE
jgi:hypothetical protein